MKLVRLLSLTLLSLLITPNAACFGKSLLEVKVVGFEDWEEPMEVPFTSKEGFSSWDEPMEVPLTSKTTKSFFTRNQFLLKLEQTNVSKQKARIVFKTRKGRAFLPKGTAKICCSSCRKTTVTKITKAVANLAACEYLVKGLTHVKGKGLDAKLVTKQFCKHCNKTGSKAVLLKYRFANEKTGSIRVSQSLV